VVLSAVAKRDIAQWAAERGVAMAAGLRYHRVVRTPRLASVLGGTLFAIGACGGGKSGGGGAAGTAGPGSGGSTAGGAGGSTTGTAGGAGTAGTTGTGGSVSTAGTTGSGGGGRGGTTGAAGAAGGRGGATGAGGAGGTSGTAGTTGTSGSTGTGGTGGAASPPVSKYIVVDQFGYLPDLEKVAVIRDPQTGFDSGESFAPGATYALVNASTGARAFMAAPTTWNGGATDTSSGDKAWWFTFTSFTTPGDYYVLDIDKNVRSYTFTIGDQVYRDVLAQAVRMLFYQRAGQAKDAAHAGAGWTDAASFTGALQDAHVRLFSDKNNAATERDLHGGWYDAGDLNKYTSWTAGYVETLLRAYAENPTIWRDDTNIPESGNGVPDVIDEAMWGVAFLTRMQSTDGSVLSIVGEPSASPPSTATGQSLYGPANTSATLATAAAFAAAARILKLVGNTSLSTAADGLLAQAKLAWTWAVANPNVQFKNNDSASGSSGLGSGQQETDDYGRLVYKLDAAAQLFAVTGDATYKTFFDANYTQLHLFSQSYVSPWDVSGQDAALDYADATGATAATATAIRNAYLSGAKGSGNLGAITSNKDPYLAYMQDYVWGSNSTKSQVGNMFAASVSHKLDAASNADMTRAASRYVHYLHGTNPLSIVYLTNMYAHGAENCANEMFHTWFADGSALWDRVGTSTYGPPPGYLTGGANNGYDWDACCPSNCSGGAVNNAMCTAMSISPPKGQPQQKSYKDFNSGWPLDSWSVTEPSDGYQVAYIRLLSKFVR
jgi:endoglucanase